MRKTQNLKKMYEMDYLATNLTMSHDSWHQPVGISLACCSGLLIGSSLVIQKKALIQTNTSSLPQNELAYLKSPLWWVGMLFCKLLSCSGFG